MTSLSDRLIAEGCEPRVTQVPAGLYDAFFAAAMETLRTAPGLTANARARLAKRIALRCQTAAKKQESHNA